MLRRAIALSGLLAGFALTTGCVPPPVMKPYVKTFPPPPPVASTVDLLPDALGLLPAGGTGANVEHPAYRVGPGDRLSVRVWGRPELGSQVPIGPEMRVTVVAEDGTIRLPFLDPIQLAEDTVGEISALVTAAYAHVVESPQVETYLESCRSQTVAVNGGVQKPGTQHICDTLLTVGELLRAADGITTGGDAARAVLRRDGVRYRLDLRSAASGENRAADIVLHDGDIVYVPVTQERLVYLFGEVLRPGTYTIPEKGLNLVEALGLAGGYLGATAKIKELYLARVSSGTPVIYRMTISQLLGSPDVNLAPGDRVLLPPKVISQWNRWMRQLLPRDVNQQTLTSGGGF